jgi:hypothetical protein
VRDTEIVDAGYHGIEVDLSIFHKFIGRCSKTTPTIAIVNYNSLAKYIL